MSQETNEQIRQRIRSDDGGFCNPMKIKMADEDRQSAIETLEDRGYSRAEAKAYLDDDD